ncbi:MAG: hypothetical protein Q8P22_00810 [Chloroflexota bacterium]|nr:hypothetical protein [Chloroflexota bacterium]
MIVTRTPLRISLGGGGTDIPSYYSRHKGFLVSAAINKYVYIFVNRRFEDSVRISYSKTEIVDRVEDIQHPIVREALKMVGLSRALEIVSVADLPGNTGLGSSSAFAVGLLNALHTYKREQVSPLQLAEEAYSIEVERLKEPIGKQDQYVAAFGGIPCLEIDNAGQVRVTQVEVSEEVTQEFENTVALFYTGIQRRASDVLGEQSKGVAQDAGQVLQAMHTIKAIGYEVKAALETGYLMRFGELLDKHWETKKLLSSKVSSGQIDRWYDLARQNGALGGKIMGAGGGGFFMFCCPNGRKAEIRRALATEGLREVRYAIEFEGSKVMVNF